VKKYLLIDDEGQDPQGAVRLLREHGYRVSESADGVIPERETKIAAGRTWTIASASGQSAFPDIHSSREAVLVAGAADGRVLDLNTSFSDLTGYGREELLGQPILGLSFFLNPESWSDALAILTEGGKSVDLETRILRRDGLVSFVRVSIWNAEMDGMPGHVLTFRNKGPNASVGTLGEMSGFSIADPESLLSGDRDLSRQEIGGMIDYHALQDLMNSFHKATKLPMAITDINGNVLVAIGWQEICTRFHRLHPETLKNCMESDTYVTRNIAEGKYSLYKCRNNMWDIATPIIISGKHIANIFMGQFLFDDEVPDYDLFRKQAQTYGFDEKEYLAALDRVPRWSRKTIESSMEFFTKLATLISRISIGNIQLTQSLAQQQRISDELHQANLVVENSPVVLFRWRATEGWPVELVSANVVQFGYTREELLSGAVPFAAMVHPEDLERVASEVADYCAEGVESFQQEYRIITKGGDTRWVYDRTFVERNSNGRISHFQGIVFDFTERKRADAALRESEGKFRVLAETAPAAIVLHQGDTFIYANPATSRFFGYGEEELLEMNFWDWAPEDCREMVRERGLARLRGESVPLQYEHKMLTKGGEEKWVVISAGVIEYRGQPTVIVTLLDITEAKRAEELVNAALAEKVVLLKEVHHRVKNNLQIICSLLDLQSEGIRDEVALAAFRESQDRIKTMALSHERLYESADFTSIDFAMYINDLSVNLLQTYMVDTGRVALKIDSEEISIGLEQAIPCGLIINELITNAIKHAFPGDRQGEIRVSFCKGEDGQITLRVADNGIGLPSGMDITRTGTLGMQLVTMLAKQLRGELTMEGNKGAAFLVRFCDQGHR